MASSVEFPSWLTSLSSASLALAAACATVIIIDEVNRPQKMWIMNIVWPVTALFGSVLWLAGYFSLGTRAGARAAGGRLQ